MAMSETKVLSGTTFTARCLSVAEVREVIAKVDAREPGARQDLVEYLIEDSLPHEAFYLSLGMDGESGLDCLESPEEIVELMDMVAKVNPTFAEAERRLVARIKDQLSALNSLKTPAQT